MTRIASLIWLTVGTFGAGIHRLADRRLLCTAVTTKGSRQGGVRSHPIVYFHHPMSTGHDVNEGILQLFHWCIFDDLLFDLHMVLNCLPYTYLSDSYARQGQAGSWRKFDTVIHGDSSPFAS